MMETAIMIGLLLAVVLCIVDVARMMYISNAFESAARDAARIAVVNTQSGTPLTDSTKVSAVSRFGNGGKMAGDTITVANVTITCSTGCTTPSTGSIKVAITDTVKWVTPFGTLLSKVLGCQSGCTLGTANRILKATAEYRYEL